MLTVRSLVLLDGAGAAARRLIVRVASLFADMLNYIEPASCRGQWPEGRPRMIPQRRRLVSAAYVRYREPRREGDLQCVWRFFNSAPDTIRDMRL